MAISNRPHDHDRDDALPPDGHRSPPRSKAHRYRAWEAARPRALTPLCLVRTMCFYGAMSHYTFTISQGGQAQPSTVSDFADDESAKREAAGMFADVARDIAKDLQSAPDWQIEVSDDEGRSILRIRVTAESR